MWWMLLSCTSSEPGRVHEDHGCLFDEQGRQLLLRGVNARVDGIFDVSFDDGRTALETLPPFGAEDCRYMSRDLGMNVLRLPVNWSGIEPDNDAFDEAYIEAVFELVDACHEEGVYTVVDLHQDAYGKDIGEDGAPLWAIVPPPEELLEGPLEDLAERRTSEQVLAAFASLYDDAEGLRGEYAQLGTVLGPHFADHPGAIALELHNEPVPMTNREGLDALHRAITGALRAEDAEVMVLFEPDSLRNLLDYVPVDYPFAHDNAVYAPHLYTGIFQGEPGSRSELEDSFAAMNEEAAEHEAALFVGEWGADPGTDEGMTWIAEALDVMDGGSTDNPPASWTFWVYEEYSQDQWGLYDTLNEQRTGVRDELVQRLARPFPMAVDGRVEAMDWDGEELTVRLRNPGAGLHLISAPQALWSSVYATCDGAPVDVIGGRGRAEMRCRGSELVVSGS
jgi:endoglycosylceramidase